jgi:phenylpropionate dioxygenase-like ring-hydroxylating dioxygenase large terminal subunit
LTCKLLYDQSIFVNAENAAAPGGSFREGFGAFQVKVPMLRSLSQAAELSDLAMDGWIDLFIPRSIPRRHSVGDRTRGRQAKRICASRSRTPRQVLDFQGMSRKSGDRLCEKGMRRRKMGGVTMNTYRHNVEAVRDLVRETEVHRDLYIDQGVFQLEMEHLFANTWVYVGHDSQVPNPGDYFGTTIGTQPVMMVRHSDQSVHVLHNRCPHKGTRITTETCGNTGKFFRCPYHAWSFKTDGSLLAIPLRNGYENTGIEASHAGKGMSPVRHVRNYRGFVFAKLTDHGTDFETFFGESLSSIDNMVDRSPVGKLEVAGGVLRYMHNCNWKMLVENQTDTCHPMVAHASSAGTAINVWRNAPPGSKKPMAVEIYAPFMASYQFFEGMGIRVWPNGHGHTGVSHSIHSDYSAVPGYFEMMVEAYGEARAKAILDENRHNTVYFPNTMIKGPIQLLRVFKPIAADKTLVESWTFRLVGAPDMLLERTVMYNRLINAPTSVVGHDDLEMYERAQEGLHVDANQWVNLQRLYSADEGPDATAVTNGTTEWQMRNQFRAWKKFMTMSM